MSTTRLLMLGAVRTFQPVHGYFVRRELMTWRVEQWASLNPGSIYNALRTLTREGFLEEVGTESSGGRPARTSYRLTRDGEDEFYFLLRDALWTVHESDPSRLMAGLSFMWALTREEVRAALESRIAQIEAQHRGLRFSVGDLVASPMKPRHVAEIFYAHDARQRGEAEWARALIERLDGGEYTFAGEPWPEGDPEPAPGAAGEHPAAGFPAVPRSSAPPAPTEKASPPRPRSTSPPAPTDAAPPPPRSTSPPAPTEDASPPRRRSTSPPAPTDAASSPGRR